MRRAADLGGQAALAAMTVLAMFFKIGANILIKTAALLPKRTLLFNVFFTHIPPTDIFIFLHYIFLCRIGQRKTALNRQGGRRVDVTITQEMAALKHKPQSLPGRDLQPGIIVPIVKQVNNQVTVPLSMHCLRNETNANSSGLSLALWITAHAVIFFCIQNIHYFNIQKYDIVSSYFILFDMNKREAQIISDDIVTALKNERLRQNISCYRLAKDLGLSQSTLSYIEKLRNLYIILAINKFSVK